MDNHARYPALRGTAPREYPATCHGGRLSVRAPDRCEREIAIHGYVSILGQGVVFFFFWALQRPGHIRHFLLAVSPGFGEVISCR